MKIKIEGILIEDTYRVDKRIGGGAFGTLYSGVDVKNGQSLAIKVEDKDCECPQLPLEYRFYVLLGIHSGVPQVFHFGPCGIYHALVMEMLGPSLDKMFESCGKRFSADTTARIGQQLIDIIEFIHSKRIIFRDVKPENFLLGLQGSGKANTVHVIDFGLAKEYISMKTGRHIPMKSGKNLIGTPRYMSTRCHLALEQSRRDDLESIGYMLIYFMKTRLPWMGLKGKGKERYERIGRVKMQTSVKDLCRDIPKPFAQYLSYVKTLGFDVKPDYKLLSDYFSSLISHNGKYDWESSERQPLV